MGPGPNLKTWSDIARIFGLTGMSLPGPWDKSWSWNISQTMVIHDQEGETWLQPFNVSQWAPRKGNTCHYEVKICPVILINKKCHSYLRFLASKYEWGLPKQRSRGCCHPPWWLPRSWGNVRSKVNKEIRLAPDSWGAYERSEFSEPRGLHLPIHGMLNSLIPDL